MEAGRKAEYELSTEECLALVDEMKRLGTEMLILTGGKPLMRKDIFEIARYASVQEMWVVMGTNGVLVTEKVAQKMVECGVKGVAVSIDSIDADKHNQFRGGPNSWEYSIKALKICRARGLPVLVQTTISESNYEEIPQLIEFTRELGAWSFNLYFLVQTGRGQQMNDLSPRRTRAMLEKLVEIQDNYRPMLVRSKCAPQFKQIAYEMGMGGLESGGCMAGTEYCRITPEGSVTPCPYMTVVAGNVLESGFQEVWQNSPVLQELRDLKKLKGRCGRCEFMELCGGCRCRAYAAFGDYLQEDPACTYQPNGNLQLPETGNIAWAEAAQARLERIPIAFIRNKVKKGVEAYARRQGKNRITPDLMKEALAGEERTGMFRNMPAFLKDGQ
jgi:radical SAM protein with 4Fe4S-binding SPASM domain